MPTMQKKEEKVSKSESRKTHRENLKEKQQRKQRSC